MKEFKGSIEDVKRYINSESVEWEPLFDGVEFEMDVPDEVKRLFEDPTYGKEVSECVFFDGKYLVRVNETPGMDCWTEFNNDKSEMKRTSKNVTILKTETVLFDGISACSICGREIAYRKNTHSIPTTCNSCVNDMPDLMGKMKKSGDGYVEN